MFRVVPRWPEQIHYLPAHNLHWQEVPVIHPPLDHSIELLSFHKGFLVTNTLLLTAIFYLKYSKFKTSSICHSFQWDVKHRVCNPSVQVCKSNSKNVDLVLPLSGKPGSWRNSFQNLQGTFPLPDRLYAWELKPLAATSGNNYWISTVYIACITWWFLWVIIPNWGRAVSKSCSAPNTVVPNRAGGQYRTIDLPKMFFVGSGPLQSRQSK
jgi:hypothetical protein